MEKEHEGECASSSRYGALGASSLASTNTVADLLAALNLTPLLESFTSHGVTALDHIDSTALDSMGLSRGIRVRLLRALAERQSMLCQPDVLPCSGASPMDAVTTHQGGTDVTGDAQPPGLGLQPHLLPSDLTPRPSPNSTSSLYIASTIAHPDMAQVSVVADFKCILSAPPSSSLVRSYPASCLSLSPPMLLETRRYAFA